MPDILNATGLTVETATEITDQLVTGLQGIYGADINVDQNSSDGEEIGIFAQQGVDIRELAVQVYNSFDPDQAIGSTLDQRVAINNVQRQGGTYTIQPITIITNATVILQGLDSNFNNPLGTGYTVQDSSGNRFILLNSITLTAGTYSIDFRAFAIGDVNVPINTITNPVTIISGVVSVNNPTGASTIGQTQETDIQLRTRRQQSTRINSQGYLDALRGRLLALTGVTEAQVYENRTGSTVNGIPAKSIWAVVAGGSSSDIANVLYRTLNPGPGMKGSVTFNITTTSGGLFVAQWDVPVPENLYVQFNLKTIISGFSFNIPTIQSYIAKNQVYNIGQFAETSSLTATAVAAIASQGGGGVPIDVKISTDNATWVDYLTTTTLASQFSISSGNISITVV